MTILSDIPDANEPVLQEFRPIGRNNLQELRPAGRNNLKLARRAVDEAISDISEFLTDDEVAEVADALRGLLDRWRNPPTA